MLFGLVPAFVFLSSTIDQANDMFALIVVVIGVYVCVGMAYTMPFVVFGQLGLQIQHIRKKKCSLDVQVFAVEAFLLIVVGVNWRQLVADVYPEALSGWGRLFTDLQERPRIGAWLWAWYVVMGVGYGIIVGLNYYWKSKDDENTVHEQANEVVQGTQETTPLLGERERSDNGHEAENWGRMPVR